jgi:hypothetical protein
MFARLKGNHQEICNVVFKSKSGPLDVSQDYGKK